jgi:hypothetical protein
MINTIFKSRSFLLIGLLCFAAFSPVLRGEFKTMDDEFTIVTNSDLRSVKSLPGIFSIGYFKSARDYYRPLTVTSYLVENLIFGLDAFFFNLDNILLHILNAWLVFLIAGLILDDRRKAWWVSLLYGVHPLHWEAVGNISGRAILLCAVFTLAAFFFFLKYVKEEKSRNLWMAGACFVLGLFSKESAGVLILVLPFYLVVMRRRNWGALLPFAGIMLAYFIWRKYLGLTHLYPWRNFQELFLGFTTFINGVFVYMRLIVMPAGLYFDRSVPLLISLKAPAVPVTWAVYLAGVAGLWLARRRLSLIVIFCIGWFFIELLPVSQIVTSIGVQSGRLSLAEHFLYMALVPACILMVLAVDKIVEEVLARGIMRREFIRIAAWGVVAMFMVTAQQQSFYASNEAAMIKQSLAADPYNARLQFALGRRYVLKDDFASAERHFRMASGLDPAVASFRISWGRSIADQGRYDEALAVYEQIKDPGGFAELLKDNMASARQLREENKNASSVPR